MPNQPSKDGATIYLRLPQVVKDQIQTSVDQINSTRPPDTGAVTLSSWVRTAIDMRLETERSNPAKKK